MGGCVSGWGGWAEIRFTGPLHGRPERTHEPDGSHVFTSKTHTPPYTHTPTHTRAHTQSLAALGDGGHALCNRIRLSNKSLSEEAAQVVAETLREMEKVCVCFFKVCVCR